MTNSTPIRNAAEAIEEAARIADNVVAKIDALEFKGLHTDQHRQQAVAFATAIRALASRVDEVDLAAENAALREALEKIASGANPEWADVIARDALDPMPEMQAVTRTLPSPPDSEMMHP